MAICCVCERRSKKQNRDSIFGKSKGTVNINGKWYCSIHVPKNKVSKQTKSDMLFDRVKEGIHTNLGS